MKQIKLSYLAGEKMKLIKGGNQAKAASSPCNCGPACHCNAMSTWVHFNKIAAIVYVNPPPSP